MDTLHSIQIREYLSTACSLYPHVVGKELDSKLWREKHTRYEWKKNLSRVKTVPAGGKAEEEATATGTEFPPRFHVPTEFINCIVGWNLREKKSFFYMITHRKVYLYKSNVLCDDPKKKMKKKEKQMLKKNDIQRIQFMDLPYLPVCPDIA